ncbi:hypothetical protein MASR1M101_24480 [Gemmatimonas sp.]
MVSAYWAFDVAELPSPDFVHRVWPDGCASLLIACVGPQAVASVIRGATRDAFDVPVVPGTRYRGIRFRPEWGAYLLGARAADLRNRNLEAYTLLGDEVRILAAAVAHTTNDGDVHALFDGWIEQRMQYLGPARDGVDANAVSQAVSLLMQSNGQLRVSEVAAACGVNPRTLQRRFVDAVGLTMKQFAQVRRARGMLRRSVEEQRPERFGWAQVAAESGYADQAHLSREVTRHMRLTPARVQDRLAEIEHEGLVD